ncbi:hypothetical protein WU87_00150 [Corynebacterium minutissimum]|uniref:Uncharacterized protein n=1 Tax=Corynebacterium minutissimum TaxID=38301 RepID=A0ACC4UD88_9CORY|nr:hypothetical protein WU87_00150 [Corynebacterium minutissimum]
MLSHPTGDFSTNRRLIPAKLGCNLTMSMALFQQVGYRYPVMADKTLSASYLRFGFSGMIIEYQTPRHAIMVPRSHRVSATINYLADFLIAFASINKFQSFSNAIPLNLYGSTATVVGEFNTVLRKVSVSRLWETCLFQCAIRRLAAFYKSNELLVLIFVLILIQAPMALAAAKSLSLTPHPRLSLRDPQLLEDHRHRTRIMQIRLHIPLT